MATMQIGNLSYQPADVIKKAHSARGWFLAIIIFSFINTLLVLFKANISFVIGLGVTQVVDGLMTEVTKELGGSTGLFFVIGFLINLIPLGLYFFIWWLSGKGSVAAYVTGIVLYLLDTLLMLAFQDWFGAAFHAYFLFQLFSGYPFIKAYRQAEATLAAPAASEAVPTEV